MMRATAENVVFGSGDFLVGGAQRFLHKGTNGRWKGVLTEDDLNLCEKTAIERLSPDGKQWLEFGTLA